MNPEKTNLFTWMGLESVPWRIRVFLLLVALFLLLLLATAFLDLSSSVAGLAEDGLKMVLGALLGSLALTRKRRDDEPMSDSVE